MAWTTAGLVKTPGIPAPTGQYNVGCADILTESDGLLLRLFYPTHVQLEGTNFQFAPTTPHPRYTRALLEAFGLEPVGLVTFFAKNFLDSRAPALVGAPLYNKAHAPTSNASSQHNSDAATFPVIVFSHGLHAHRAVYSAMCCDLASHGYVVAAVEHKDQSACLTFNRIPGPGVAKGDYDHYITEWIPGLDRPLDDFSFRNKQLRQRCSEISKTLDLLQLLNNGGMVRNVMDKTFNLMQFTGRLDTKKAVVMGHSFGGATTVNTLARDDRFVCGIAMDTWMFPVGSEVYDGRVSKPLLFINSYRFQWAENVARMMEIVTPPNRHGFSRCSLVTLKRTTHYNQTDAGFVMPPFINSTFSKTDVYQVHRVNFQLCTAFLYRYVLKDPSFQKHVPLLDGGEGCNEYVLYGTNVDWKSAMANETVKIKSKI